MIPITATHKPQASFFRRRQFRSLEENDSSDETSDSSLGESSSSEEDRSAQQGLPSSSPAVAFRKGTRLANELDSIKLNSVAYAPPRRGIDVKLSLVIIRSRQLLDAASFAELSISLKSLSAALPASSLASGSLGIFAPILFRFVEDLRKEVSRERSREWREGISSRNATALVGLAQRWDSVKGKGKERELEWVKVVMRQIQSVSISNPFVLYFSLIRRCRSTILRAWSEMIQSERRY